MLSVAPLVRIFSLSWSAPARTRRRRREQVGRGGRGGRQDMVVGLWRWCALFGSAHDRGQEGERAGACRGLAKTAVFR